MILETSGEGNNSWGYGLGNKDGGKIFHLYLLSFTKFNVGVSAPLIVNSHRVGLGKDKSLKPRKLPYKSVNILTIKSIASHLSVLSS